MKHEICEHCLLYGVALKHAAVLSKLAEVDSIMLDCHLGEAQTATMVSRVTLAPNNLEVTELTVEITGPRPTGCPHTTPR